MNDGTDEHAVGGPLAGGWRGRLLGPLTPGAARAIVYLFILMMLLAATNLLYTARQTSGADMRARVQCRFDADLGSAPVTVSPKVGKPAVLGVTIVSDARVAWHQLGCPGRLAPPAPSFVRWAAYYHLPVN